MKNIFKILAVLIALSPLSVQAANVTVPSSPGLGSLLYGKANGNYTTLNAGANGDCLKLTLGLPAWGSCGTGGGGGTDGNWSFFNGSGIRLATTSNQVLIGASSTTTLNALEVIGRGYFSAGILAPASSTIHSLSVTNGTTTNATTTKIFSTTASSTSLFSLNATTTSLGLTGITSSLLKTTATGGVTSAVSGTDFSNFGASVGPTELQVTDFGDWTCNGTTCTLDATYLTGNQTITLSGDVSGSGSTAITTTLATVNSNTGSFGSSSAIPNFTVNAKGLITAAGTNAVVAPAGTLTGTTLAANVVSSSLTSVGTLANLTVTNTITGSVSGNAGTATALAANGTNCSAGNYPLGVDASGNAEDCTVAGTGSGSWATTSEQYYWSQFRDWSIVNGALSPTTTLGILVSASSSITRLSSLNSTSTNATSTNLTVSSTLRLSGLNCSGNVNGGALTTDANGFVSCSDDDGGGGGGSIDGAGLAGMMTSWTDSNTIQATSTIVGATFHGTSTTATSTFANAVRVDNYLSVGPDLYSGTYPELVDTFSPDNYIADFTRDVNDYASVNVTNKNAGANASAIYTLNNNLSGYYPDSDAFHYYGELTYNSSNFNNPIYGATNVPNAVTLNSSDGPVLISSATTSAAGYISLIAGGVATDDLRITTGGNVGIGTSSPAANLSIAGRATQGTQPLLLISSTTAAYATTTKLIIDSQGRVAINPKNTSALNAQLNVFPKTGSGISDDLIRFFNTGGSQTVGINASGVYTGINIDLNPGSGATGVNVNQNASGIGYNITAPAAATANMVRIQKTGRGIVFAVDRFGQLSIGSSTPSAMLSITSSSTASTTLSLNAFSNQTADILQAWRATNTKAFVIQGNGYVGVGTSTPFTGLSIGLGNGSSTQAILVAEHRPATSTSMTIDWKMGNTQNIRLGNSAMTVSFSNFSDGGTLKVLTCNPPTGTAGAVTWGTEVLWSGGTAPTQTTTAQKCDVWSFIATQATSTLKIFGTMSSNF